MMSFLFYDGVILKCTIKTHENACTAYFKGFSANLMGGGKFQIIFLKNYNISHIAPSMFLFFFAFIFPKLNDTLNRKKRPRILL